MRTKDHGTRLNSRDYQDKKERLEVFNKLFGTETPIKDVEFDFFNVNGFDDTRSIPGASSIRYRYVLKVDPADVNYWTDFLSPITLDTSFAWQDSLVSSHKEQWVRTSVPLYFVPKFSNEIGGLIVTAYKPEGIIFREVINN